MNYGVTERRGIAALSALGVLRTQAARPTSKGPRANAVVGALIVSPTAVQDKLRTTNGQVQALGTDILSNLGALTDANAKNFVTTWTDFSDNWQKFYDDHQTLTKILLTGTGTLDRKITDYQTQLLAWSNAFEKQYPNARRSAPPPLPPTSPPNGVSVPWWGISLLTLLGTAALGYISYASYVYAKDAQRKKKILEEDVVPAVLAGEGFGPGLFRRRAETSPDSFTRVHASHDPAFRNRGTYERIERARGASESQTDGSAEEYEALAQAFGESHEEIQRRLRRLAPSNRYGSRLGSEAGWMDEGEEDEEEAGYEE